MKEKSPILTIIHPTYSFHSSKTTFFLFPQLHVSAKHKPSSGCKVISKGSIWHV